MANKFREYFLSQSNPMQMKRPAPSLDDLRVKMECDYSLPEYVVHFPLWRAKEINDLVRNKMQERIDGLPDMRE